MSTLVRLSLMMLLSLTVFSSCDKEKETEANKPREEPLLPNQIDEPDGIRFILTWSVKDGSVPQNNAELDLELYQGVGSTKSTTPITLIPNPHNFINYSVLETSLKDGEEHTLMIKYGKVLKDGTYDLYIEGYTAIANKKKFTINGNAFTTGNANMKKDFLKIKRNGTRYTFTVI